MKNRILSVLMLALLIVSKSAICEQYPATYVVESVDTANDMLYLSTFTGNVFKYSGIEDWMTGDIASAIMSDNGTPDDITDDEILRLVYSGYIY